jgi:hypothetical protein
VAIADRRLAGSLQVVFGLVTAVLCVTHVVNGWFMPAAAWFVLLGGVTIGKASHGARRS